MIIPAEEGKLKAKEGYQEQVDREDPPPSYAPSSSKADAGPSDLESISSMPRPFNYISVVRRHQSVKGTYVVDPAMVIPQSLLPPLEYGEKEGERKNVRLESESGSVNVNIILASTTANQQRATIRLWSKHGGVVARLVAGPERPGIDLNAESDNGSVTLYLPRSFRGFLTLSTKHGTLCFSDSVNSHVTTFSHVDKTTRCFIGDVTEALASDGAHKDWRGDEVMATTRHGKVKIFYNDEEVKSPKTSSFLSRVFGR